MAAFQVVVADPETGDTYQFDVEDQAATRFIGKSIADDVDGSAVGLDGYTLSITGGSDNAGRPMHEDLEGVNLREILVAERSTGYRPNRDGERNRISVRGNEISDETAQVNTKITDRGDQSIEDLLGGDDEASSDDTESAEDE